MSGHEKRSRARSRLTLLCGLGAPVDELFKPE